MPGHASAAATLDVHADLFENDLDRAATALNRAAMRSDVADPLPKTAQRRLGDRRQEQENPGETGGFLVLPTVAETPPRGLRQRIGNVRSHCSPVERRGSPGPVILGQVGVRVERRRG